VSGPRRAVWLDEGLVPDGRAALPIDDPAVRWGEGLLETMRAEGGRVALLERHLDRLLSSAAALGLGAVPGREPIREAVAAAVGALGAPSARVRLTVTARPTLLVEATPEPPAPPRPPAARAVAVAGAWCPESRIAEHKTLSFAGHRLAQRVAEAAGADHALLLDADGRLGEAAIANVFVAVGGEVVTAPARGLLAGVSRGVVMDAVPVREEALPGPAWRAADEVVLTNAVRGAVAVVEVDGAPVGDGRPGPLASRLAVALHEAWG
jgi:branched-subunit amino acid aminotransferase/4-amino-4-deoxychorismate lyase